MIGIEADAANMCLHASERAVVENVPEPRRIAFAVKCVRVLSYDIDDLSRDARVPRTFISSLAANVVVLRKFAESGKLTAEQSDVLIDAEGLVAQLKKRCSRAQMDGADGKDEFGFDC